MENPIKMDEFGGTPIFGNTYMEDTDHKAFQVTLNG